VDWGEVVSSILSLSREGRFEELKDFLARNGIAILGDSPCISRRTFFILCVGDRVTVHYHNGVRSGVIAGFSIDGAYALIIGCKSERPCRVVYPASVYLPSVISIDFKEFSQFHLTYGAKMILDFIGSGGESSEGG
jgi:hypothetical protein